ncbi:MAG TPA: hypothetical protein VF438_04095 [Candidatus Paceibacterota bacterium]
MRLRHFLYGCSVVAAGVVLALFAARPVPADRLVVHPQQAAVADILTIPTSTFTSHKGVITEASPDLFAYAHGTAMAHGKIFIGMAGVHGNTYPTNTILVFDDLTHLDHVTRLTIPGRGDIQTMVYDEATDMIYFMFSKNHRLDLYRLDPNTYAYSALISTSSVDVGMKPAITTGGGYVYGITQTDPATVFKVRIADGELSTHTTGHIKNGHSAAIGKNGSQIELYFGGGESSTFEKVDASTLDSVGIVKLPGCILTNDMPYQQTDANGGFVYIGCETTPEGYRIRTADLHTTRFPLPGQSFGLFIFGNDLYNGSYDGHVDVFPNMDIGNLHRYYLTNGMKFSLAPGNELYLNQMFYDPATGGLYVTAWWGVKNLFKVSLGT